MVAAEAADTAEAVEAVAVTPVLAADMEVTAEVSPRSTGQPDYKVFFPRPEVAPPGEFGPSFSRYQLGAMIELIRRGPLQ